MSIMRVLRAAIFLSVAYHSVCSYAAAVVPKAGYSSTVLCDGRVFVAFEDTIEIYDPKTQSWISGPHLKQARIYHGAVLDPSCKVWLIGGINPSSNNPSSSTEIFDPSAGMTTIGPSLKETGGLGATVVGSDIAFVSVSGIEKISLSTQAVTTQAFPLSTVNRLLSKAIKINGDDVYLVLGSKPSDKTLQINYYDLSHPENSKSVNLLDEDGRAYTALGVSLLDLGDGRIFITGGFTYHSSDGSKDESLYCSFFDPNTTVVTTCSKQLGINAESKAYFDFFRPFDGTTAKLGSDEVVFFSGSIWYETSISNRQLRVFNTKTGGMKYFDSDISVDEDLWHDLTVTALPTNAFLLLSPNHVGSFDPVADYISYDSDSSFARQWSMALPTSTNEVLLAAGKRTEIYNPYTRVFREGPINNLPFSGYEDDLSEFVNLNDGKILLSSSRCMVYDPSTLSFSSCPNLPYKGSVAAFGKSGVLLVGHKEDGSIASVSVYRRGDASWSQVPTAGLPNTCHPTKIVSFSSGDVALICSSNSSIAVYSFSEGASLWKTGAQIPFDVSCPFSALAFDSHQILIAGYIGLPGGGNNVVDGILDMTNGQWTQLDTLPYDNPDSFWGVQNSVRVSPTEVLLFGSNGQNGTIRGVVNLSTKAINWLNTLHTSVRVESGRMVPLSDGTVVWIANYLERQLPQIVYAAGARLSRHGIIWE